MLAWVKAVPMRVRLYWLGAGALGLTAIWMADRFFHSGAALQAAAARYSYAKPDAGNACPLGSRSGIGGRTERKSARGVPITVVTPSNYRGDVSHPLLMVYAPAGFGPGFSERYAGLTGAATAAGFVVAYAGSLQLRLETVDRLAAVPGEVIEGWCIDPARVYATGHSDGGTVSTAIAALPRYRGRVGGIVASGMGWAQQDFDTAECPEPLPVMLLHGAQDSHFPGFGRAAARWWSACNRCTDAGEPAVAGSTGEACHRYRGCSKETVYCEPERSHWRWAGEPRQVVDFLARQSAAAAAANAPRAREMANHPGHQ